MNDEIRRTYYQTLARQHQAATEGQLLGWNREVIEARLQLTEDAWKGLMREHMEMIKQTRTSEEKEINDLFMVKAETKYMEVKVMLLRGINENKSRSYLDHIEKQENNSDCNDGDSNEDDYNKNNQRRRHSRWGPLKASRDGSSTSTYGRNIELNMVKQEQNTDSNSDWGDVHFGKTSVKQPHSPDTDSWDKDDIFKDALPLSPPIAEKSSKFNDSNEEQSSGIRRSYQSDDNDNGPMHNDGGRRTRPWKSASYDRGESTKRTRYASPTSPNSKNSVECIVCQQPHPLYRCETFLDMPLNARQNLVRTNELCRSCLSKGHYVNTCKENCCKRCPTRMHNSTLCPKCPREFARFKRHT